MNALIIDHNVVILALTVTDHCYHISEKLENFPNISQPITKK